MIKSVLSKLSPFRSLFFFEHFDLCNMPRKRKLQALRQNTLSDTLKLTHSPSKNPQKTPSHARIEQPLRVSGTESSDDNLGAIKLESVPVELVDTDTDENPSPRKRKLIMRGSSKAHMIVVSDEENRPIHKRRRLQKARTIESSEEENLEEEVDKERKF
jgi:hypothetical protein